MITKHEAYDLSRHNTFGMKVSCRLYVEVTAPEDLPGMDFASLPQPLFVMGGGSNLLFTGDYPGTVLHPAIRFLDTARKDKESVPVTVGAGVVFDDFCAWAAQEGLWGPENLSLIPGEVGASAVQNIGAYGVETKDIIDTVHAFDLQERRFVDIPGTACGYGYRASLFKTAWKGRYLITAVTFRLSTVPRPRLDYGGVRKALEARFPVKPGMTEDNMPGMTEDNMPGMTENVVMPDLIGHLTPQMIRETIIGIRREKLPDPEEVGSAGSFFCNPVVEKEHFERIVATAKEENGPEYVVPHYDVGGRVKVPAAWMIDQCGFKGMRLGGAQVYPKQPLVIVNATGGATPDEIVALERKVIEAVRGKYGVELHPEVEHVTGQVADKQ